MKKIFTLIFALIIKFTCVNSQVTILSQDWSNAALITVNNDWTGVPNIIGYRGDMSTAVGDPQIILADSIAIHAAIVNGINVTANATAPSTQTSGGLYEFAIANPVVAMQGSGTADAPYLLITIPTTGLKNIRVRYNLRDVDDGTDNAVQQFALHYRSSGAGAFTNVAGGYVADASSGPSLADKVTPVDVTLPVDANDKVALYLRIMTTNAAGSDELIGIDDIIITGEMIPTPVELVYVKASINSNFTNLYWQTASEKDNSHFAIERSQNGESFSKIGEVKCNGNSSVILNYEHTDATPYKGINYYRLRQVDFDGTESVSKTVSVNFDGRGQNKMKVYPTLVKDAVSVELSDESKAEISVRDLTGRVILTQNTEGVSNTTLNLGNLSSGLYIMSVRSNETLETVKIYKQ